MMRKGVRIIEAMLRLDKVTEEVVCSSVNVTVRPGRDPRDPFTIVTHPDGNKIIFAPPIKWTFLYPVDDSIPKGMSEDE